MTGEAAKLERAGQLVEARAKYAESQALIEVKDVTDALKRLDEDIHKRVKDALNDSRNGPGFPAGQRRSLRKQEF